MTRKRKRLKKLAQSIGIQRNDFGIQKDDSGKWYYRMSIGAYDLYADPLDYDAIVSYIRDRQKRWPIKIIRGKRAEAMVTDCSFNKEMVVEIIKNFKINGKLE